MPAGILVADDHEVVRQGIRAILQSRPDWEICGEAVDGHEAVCLAEELHPDVIVMDITMPRMSGLEASQEIARLKLPARVLIFTMHESKSLAPSVRKAGAQDTSSNLVPPATSSRLWSVSSPTEPFSMLHLLPARRLGRKARPGHSSSSGLSFARYSFSF